MRLREHYGEITAVSSFETAELVFGGREWWELVPRENRKSQFAQFMLKMRVDTAEVKRLQLITVKNKFHKLLVQMAPSLT